MTKLKGKLKQKALQMSLIPGFNLSRRSESKCYRWRVFVSALKNNNKSKVITKVYDVQQSICLHFPHQNFVRKFGPNFHKIMKGCANWTLFLDKRVSDSHNLSLFYANLGRIFIQSFDGENVNKCFVVRPTF